MPAGFWQTLLFGEIEGHIAHFINNGELRMVLAYMDYEEIG